MTLARIFPPEADKGIGGQTAMEADEVCPGDRDQGGQLLQKLFRGEREVLRPVLVGEFRRGIGLWFAVPDAIIQRNTISGAENSIELAGLHPIETATIVKQNIIEDGTNDLFLNPFDVDRQHAKKFGARISLNDFINVTKHVVTTGNYHLPTELSVTVNGQGQGNCWGLEGCALGGFDPTRVITEQGVINPDFVDSYPYGEPVAEMDSLTALTCPEQGF